MMKKKTPQAVARTIGRILIGRFEAIQSRQELRHQLLEVLARPRRGRYSTKWKLPREAGVLAAPLCRLVNASSRRRQEKTTN